MIPFDSHAERLVSCGTWKEGFLLRHAMVAFTETKHMGLPSQEAQGSTSKFLVLIHLRPGRRIVFSTCFIDYIQTHTEIHSPRVLHLSKYLKQGLKLALLKSNWSNCLIKPDSTLVPGRTS